MSDRYHQPEEGTADWHVPLNQNFGDLGVEVLGEVEAVSDLPAPDPEATSSNGVPRRVLVRESRALYRDDGESWVPVAGFGTAAAPVPATAHLDAVTVDEHVRAPAVKTSQLETLDGERAFRIDSTDSTAAGPNLIGGHADNDVASDAAGATVGGGGGPSERANVAAGTFGTIGGGRGNAVTEEYASIGGGAENAASDEAATVSGGAENTADGTHAAIGGGKYNDAGGWGVVGGGFSNDASSYAVVAGGCHNTAVEYYSTVAGGDGNTANRKGATVGGGENNVAAADYATVDGGHENAADGTCATIGGGDTNNAGGHCATIPGGTANTATGKAAFAAGHRANATDDGSFVWADDHDHAADSWGENSWSARTTGGARFVTGIDGGEPASGVVLPAGSGSWETLSASDAKSNADPVDPQRVLAGVESLTINTWEYDAEADGTTHMGPMAEEFHAAFDLGSSEKSIATVDADGVAFAAIQALAKRTDDHTDAIDDHTDAIEDHADAIGDQRETVAELRAENEKYRRRVDALEAENDGLRDEVETLREEYADLAERVAELEGEPTIPE